MKYKIRGTTLQVADLELASGEAVFTEAGGMCWMSPNVEMQTSTRGGIMKGLGRVLAGESLFLVTYKCTEGTGLISFAAEFPGKIIPLQLTQGQSIIAQRDAFMAAEDGAKLEMHFRKKLGAGLFGGEGFILQKITGPGTAFFEIAGEVTEYNLKEGQTLKVNPGYIAMFDPTVTYDITTIKGIKNILFAGEGIFLATLNGPGRIWLQSMPVSVLAGKLSRYIVVKSGG